MKTWWEQIKTWPILQGWRPYLVIVVVGFLLYSHTLFFDFTYFDDSTLILDKVAVLSNIHNIGYIFTSDVFLSSPKFYYRPFLNLSFMLDAHLGGVLPFFYHLDNILLHCLAAGLVFYLLTKLIKKRPLAFFLSLIFLVHPVLVQAVAWVPGRNDSLLAIFGLAAFITFLSFLERPRLAAYLGYLFFLLAALFTKETAVALPLLVIFYFLFIDSGRTTRTDKWLMVGGSAVAGFIWFLMRHFALGGETTNYLSAGRDIIQNAGAVVMDIGKLVFPVNLSVLPVLEDSSRIFGWMVLFLLAFAWWRSRHIRYNYVIFGIVWFLLFLLPSFIRLNGLPDFLEHRLYLSLIGFLLVLAEFDWVKNWDFTKRSGKIAAAAILLILAAITCWHSSSFSDRLTFWQEAAKDSPHSPLAQRNLGVMYYFIGDNAKAKNAYSRALQLNPQEPMAHNNLGVLYLEQKNWSAAEKEFTEELTVNPGYDKALLNLGDVYYHENRWTDAGRLWTAALSVNPEYSDAYERLLILQNRLR